MQNRRDLSIAFNKRKTNFPKKQPVLFYSEYAPTPKQQNSRKNTLDFYS